MKLTAKLTLFILLTWGFTKPAQAQKTHNCSFLEIGLGVRSFSNVPNNVLIQKDSAFYDNLDFGKGRPLAASLGFVFLPDENGFAGKFSLEGYLGNSSGFGVDIGFGYKVGNDKFSFTPMIDLQFGRWIHPLDAYNIDSSAVPASFYNPNSDAYYVGSGVNLHGGSGSSILYNLNYAALDFKLGAYLSYRLTDKFTVFGRFAFNLNAWKSKAKFEVTGSGYETQAQFIDAVFAEAANEDGEPPIPISTEVEGAIMRQNGASVEKVPLGLSGYQIQFGIGFNIGD